MIYGRVFVQEMGHSVLVTETARGCYWLAQSVECVAVDLRVMSSSPMLGVEPTYNTVQYNTIQKLLNASPPWKPGHWMALGSVNRKQRTAWTPLTCLMMVVVSYRHRRICTDYPCSLELLVTKASFSGVLGHQGKGWSMAEAQSTPSWPSNLCPLIMSH